MLTFIILQYLAEKLRVFTYQAVCDLSKTCNACQNHCCTANSKASGWQSFSSETRPLYFGEWAHLSNLVLGRISPICQPLSRCKRSTCQHVLIAPFACAQSKGKWADERPISLIFSRIQTISAIQRRPSMNYSSSDGGFIRVVMCPRVSRPTSNNCPSLLGIPKDMLRYVVTSIKFQPCSISTNVRIFVPRSVMTTAIFIFLSRPLQGIPTGWKLERVRHELSLQECPHALGIREAKISSSRPKFCIYS